MEDFQKERDYCRHFTVCNLSHKPQYYMITEKLKKYINNNNKNYKNDSYRREHKPINAVIQWYTVECLQEKYCKQPSTIYNIINHFENDSETK